MTQWPRGLADYVPSGSADAVPDAEEDRLHQRILLAGRLLAVVRTHPSVDERALVGRLRSAEAAARAGDRAGATRLLDALLAELDRAAATPPRSERS